MDRISCMMYENNRRCTVSDLTLTSKNYTFVPMAPDSNAVLKFELIKSFVPVLTSNVCTTFTKLIQFTAIEQHIEIVEDYAFNNCTELLDLNLEKNNIHKLGVGIFSNTKKLQRLHILGGSLAKLDVDLFTNLSELKQLLYSANGLKELPVEAMKNLKKLELLYLYSNDLSDLDAKGLVENLPSLTAIYLNDNNFPCDRLIEIIDVFKAKRIRIADHAYEKHLKKRDYIPRKISNVVCLTQAQLEMEKLKKALTGSLDELKDLPLGKEIIELKAIVTSGFLDSDSEIVNLSSNLNETSDHLNEQVSILNETLRNNTIEMNSSINGLKMDVHKVQLELEQNLIDTVERLQKLDEAVVSLTNKYKNLLDNSASSEKFTGNDSRTSASHTNNFVAVWVCLIILMVSIATIGLFVIKKFSNAYPRYVRSEAQNNLLLQEESYT